MHVTLPDIKASQDVQECLTVNFLSFSSLNEFKQIFVCFQNIYVRAMRRFCSLGFRFVFLPNKRKNNEPFKHNLHTHAFEYFFLSIFRLVLLPKHFQHIPKYLYHHIILLYYQYLKSKMKKIIFEGPKQQRIISNAKLLHLYFFLTAHFPLCLFHFSLSSKTFHFSNTQQYNDDF